MVSCFEHVNTQVLIMGFAFFGIPGAFNSIIGLNSGIPDDYTNLGFGILYFLFSAGSLVAPALVNKFGPRLMMCLGGTLYGIFSCSLLLAGPLQLIPYWMVTVCAALVGFGAAVLWSGNGAMLLSYPTDDRKAQYISTFWVLFNFGAVIGGLQAFFTNLHNTTGGQTSAGTFIIYIVMCVVGCALCLLLQPLENVVREDGTRCTNPQPKTAKEELSGMSQMMCFAPVMALLPLFLYSNWFYGYQLGVFNSSILTPAASGLSSACYWGAQMVGAKSLGCLLDAVNMPAGRRAYISFAGSCALIAVTWVWGVFANSSFDLDSAEPTKYDYNQSQFVEIAALMTLWGYCDALVQTWCYWVMTQLYSSPEDFARIAGVFKFAQSAGSSISFLLGYAKLSASAQLWINIVLFVLSVPGGFYLCNHVSKSSGKVALMDDAPQKTVV